jgi:hypothetical protein
MVVVKWCSLLVSLTGSIFLFWQSLTYFYGSKELFDFAVWPVSTVNIENKEHFEKKKKEQSVNTDI